MIEFADLLEPNKLYKQTLKLDHHDNCVEFFNGLTDESGVDVDANAATCAEIKQLSRQIEKLQKKRRSKARLKTFLLVFPIILICCVVLTVVFTITNWPGMPVALIPLGIALVVLAIAILLLVFRAKKINPQVKKLDEQIAQLEAKKNELIQEATNQMVPLNNMFDWNMPALLFTKTIPLIQMDQYFDKDKLQFMKEKYGFQENTEPTISSVFIQSGAILGNPFLVQRNYCEETRPYTYTGSKTIHWTTVVGSGKDRRVIHHSQTLTASVTKPKPFYFLDTYLVYSNEAAPRLNFSRTPSKANSMNEKEIQKYVKEWDKKFDKKVEKFRKEGKNAIVEMSNEEFECLFNATDRNNDVEFRLLFTPLAQKSMLDLIKCKQPYGDDFSFIKRGPLNYVKTTHAQNFNMEQDPAKFTHYSYEEIKNRFINYCDEYMQSFYYDLAPLMCIPLYQQHQTFEYIFEGKFASNVTSFETEVMANKFGEEHFKHPESDTPCILKRTSVKKSGKADQTQITAYSFKKIRHVDYFTKMGGDGLPHEIPVEWFEYVPLEQTTDFSVQECQTSRSEFLNKLNTGELDKVVSKYGKEHLILFQKGLISFLATSVENGYNGKELNDIFAVKEK